MYVTDVLYVFCRLNNEENKQEKMILLGKDFDVPYLSPPNAAIPTLYVFPSISIYKNKFPIYKLPIKCKIIDLYWCTIIARFMN